MESRPAGNGHIGSQEIVSEIDKKAMRLSALLREIDNHPVDLEGPMRERLDEILEVVACRVAATRSLLRQPPRAAFEVVSSA